MNRAFRILTAGVFINLCIGVLYAWSVISRALVAAGWSNSEASLPYTIAVVTFAAGVLIAGTLQDKMGPRKLVIAGVAMVGIGMVISSFAVNSPFFLLMTFGVLVGTGIGFAYACLSPTAMKWFHPSKKGMVNGLIAGGFGMAPLYLAPLSSSLIASMSISSTFMILGGMVLVIGLPLAFTIVVPEAGYKPEEPAGYVANNSAPAVNFTWREMVKTRQFYLMWIAFAFASSAGLLLIGNITSIAALQGNITGAAYLVSLLAVSNTGGRVLMGMLSDKLGRTKTLLLAIALQTVNMVLFPTFTTEFGFILGAVIAGIGYGALLSIFPSMTADFFGIKNYGTNFGVLYTAWGASGFMGPVIASMIVDSTGSYGMAYTISAVMLAIAGFAAFFTKPVDTNTLDRDGDLAAA
ncbi:L-lactate MFS transporter [Parendozoicomonas haliclonae]|uniref:Putative MFS-type transporter YhjX n=1 Tax=Parendozoicomonas haliclonae TaxID=1960125 RepID=A0A1X7AKS5_9GAMM|nr:OFA family MFS transporter [Parendozoicomonas haliclonae]SMA47505.1 putative MFS-type transporter YhjX [Parendozoicomonas haliclonae]